jgi:hypothetical protein
VFSLTQILPASVIATVLLFATKEILEWKRKKKSKKSKKEAYARVIGKEIKENYASIDSFFKIIEFLKEHRGCPNLELQFICLKHGYESCVIATDKSRLEMPIPIFKSEWYAEFLMELSEQEPEIAEKIEKAYDSLSFLSEKRNMLASLMAGELNLFLRMCAGSLIDFLPHERERIENELKDAYKALTGNERIFP